MKGLKSTDKGKGNKILTWLGIVATIRVFVVAVTFEMLGLADNPADKHASAEIDKKEESAVVDG